VGENEIARLGPHGANGCASSLVYMNPRVLLLEFVSQRCVFLLDLLVPRPHLLVGGYILVSNSVSFPDKGCTNIIGAFPLAISGDLQLAIYTPKQVDGRWTSLTQPPGRRLKIG
jgi:hypothetical protein